MNSKLCVLVLVGLVVAALLAESEARPGRKYGRWGKGRKCGKGPSGAICAEVDRATGATMYSSDCFNGFFENSTVFECVNSTKPYSRKNHTSDQFHCAPVTCLDDMDCDAGACQESWSEETDSRCSIDRQYRNIKKFVSSCRVEDIDGNILSEGKCPRSSQECSADDHEVITVPLQGVDTQVRAFRCQRIETEEEQDDDIVVVAP